MLRQVWPLFSPVAFANPNATAEILEKRMQLRAQLEALVDQMLDGRILLDEAIAEFEKLYIQRAYDRNRKHISRTANVLGVHRNTISKRVSSYLSQDRDRSPRNSKSRSSGRSH